MLFVNRISRFTTLAILCAVLLALGAVAGPKFYGLPEGKEEDVLWEDMGKSINCFVHKGYRLTTGIWSTAKVASARACFKRCLTFYNTGSTRWCYSWAYNTKTKKCSVSDAYGGYGAGEGSEPEPFFVKDKNYWSAYQVDMYDKRST